jgi:hypothetical protein
MVFYFILVCISSAGRMGCMADEKGGCIGHVCFSFFLTSFFRIWL